MGRALIIACLLGVLVAAVGIAYSSWVAIDVSIPSAVYAMLALGIVITVGIGSGLMALVFFSNRRGYDEAAGRHEIADHR